MHDDPANARVKWRAWEVSALDARDRRLERRAIGMDSRAGEISAAQDEGVVSAAEGHLACEMPPVHRRRRIQAEPDRRSPDRPLSESVKPLRRFCCKPQRAFRLLVWRLK